MPNRRKFIVESSLGLAACTVPWPGFLPQLPGFEGLVINDEEGEVLRLRDGTALVRIKMSKTAGAASMSFLSESFKPGDALPVHKHLYEDEFIFLYKGTGVMTLGEREYAVTEGAAAFVPKGVWHGLKNTGSVNIEMRFGYMPSGFEGFFREVGTPQGDPFVPKTMEERKAIAQKWGMIYKTA